MSRHCQSGQRSAFDGTRRVGRKVPHVIGIAVSVLSRIRTRRARCEIDGVDSISPRHRFVDTGFDFRSSNRTLKRAMRKGTSESAVPVSQILNRLLRQSKPRGETTVTGGISDSMTAGAVLSGAAFVVTMRDAASPSLLFVSPRSTTGSETTLKSDFEIASSPADDLAIVGEMTSGV